MLIFFSDVLSKGFQFVICPSLSKKENQKERLLVAYNKKKLTEIDLIRAYKKAVELELPCIILSSGELPKKLKDLISAIKEISKIEKIE